MYFLLKRSKIICSFLTQCYVSYAIKVTSYISTIFPFFRRVPSTQNTLFTRNEFTIYCSDTTYNYFFNDRKLALMTAGYSLS